MEKQAIAAAGLTPAGIEYGEFNWNFYPGCKHKQQGICPLPNCWAEGTWPRLQAGAKKRGVILPPFTEPRLIPELLLAPLSRKKPARILVDFMGDSMGDWVDPDMWVMQYGINSEPIGETKLKDIVIGTIEKCPQHQFIFLTKRPDRYQLWGEWPDNAWLGATVWNQKSLTVNCDYLAVANAKNKWLSIEPLLGSLHGFDTIWQEFYMAGIKWAVVGAQSSPKKLPEWDWVREIVDTCDYLQIPVWLKNNFGLPKLSAAGGIPFYKKSGGTMELRQELPG